MNKEKAMPGNIDEYIAGFSKDVQVVLEQIRHTINNAAPGAKETISYAMPAFKLDGRAPVYFAAFKNHIGFYPIPSGIKAFKRSLLFIRKEKVPYSSH